MIRTGNDFRPANPATSAGASAVVLTRVVFVAVPPSSPAAVADSAPAPPGMTMVSAGPPHSVKVFDPPIVLQRESFMRDQVQAIAGSREFAKG